MAQELNEKPARSATRPDDVASLSRLPRSAAANTLAAAVPLLVTVLITPLLLRKLGPAGLGVYLLAMSVVGLGVFLDFGLSTAAIAQLADSSVRKSPREAARILNSLLSVRALLAVSLAAFGLLLGPLVVRDFLEVPTALLSDATFMVRVMLIGLGLSALGGTLAVVPRAAARYDVCAVVTLATSVLSACAVAIILTAGWGLRGLAIVEASSSAVQLLSYAFIARRFMPDWAPRLGVSYSWLSRLAKLGGAFSLGTLASAILLHGPRFLLGRTLGVASVALYGVPWNVTFRVTLLAYAASETLLPVAVGLSSSSAVRPLASLYTKATTAVFVLALSICVPLFAVAPDLLTVWLGTDFSRAASTVLRFLSVGALLHSAAIVPYFMICAANGATRSNITIVACAVLSTGLLGVLAPRGLAVATAGLCGGLLVQLVVLTALACRAIGLPVGRLVGPLVKPSLSALVALTIGWLASELLSTPWLRLVVVATLVSGILQALLYMVGVSAPLFAVLRQRGRARETQL